MVLIACVARLGIECCMSKGMGVGSSQMQGGLGCWNAGCYRRNDELRRRLYLLDEKIQCGSITERIHQTGGVGWMRGEQASSGRPLAFSISESGAAPGEVQE